MLFQVDRHVRKILDLTDHDGDGFSLRPMDLRIAERFQRIKCAHIRLSTLLDPSDFRFPRARLCIDGLPGVEVDEPQVSARPDHLVCSLDVVLRRRHLLGLPHSIHLEHVLRHIVVRRQRVDHFVLTLRLVGIWSRIFHPLCIVLDLFRDRHPWALEIPLELSFRLPGPVRQLLVELGTLVLLVLPLDLI